MNAVLPTSARFMLWIDGVGGYLVCERAAVVFGRPSSTVRPFLPSVTSLSSERSEVDIAVMADVSRRHAELARVGEHYRFRPLKKGCFVDGAVVQESTWVGDGALLELGDEPGRGPRWTFRFPQSFGLTARLDPASSHRLQPHADGILLLADTCLIGPENDAHLSAPAWPRTLVLHRRPDGSLVFRADGSYDVDGARTSGTVTIHHAARIRADDFSLQLEPLP
ncbi:MAG: hypothetical protein K8U03_25120 [Planctomycetia bacterium]|nr:hypothetical protein [Planctomycetia bacterium]